MGNQPSQPENEHSPGPRQLSLPRLGSQPSQSAKNQEQGEDFIVWSLLKSCCSATNQVNAATEMKVEDNEVFHLKNNR